VFRGGFGTFRRVAQQLSSIAERKQAMEMTEYGKYGKPWMPASHPSHTLWKSLRDSHIAAEQTRASIILLSQYACAKSSSELQLRLSALEDIQEERTVFTGLSAHVEVLRQRFTQTPNNVVPMRKPPQSVREARWTHRASWVGPK
jgi:hypothetical protein